MYSDIRRCWITSNCSTPTAPRIGIALEPLGHEEELHGALLGELLEPLLQLLALQRIGEHDLHEVLGREARDALELERLALAVDQRVADAEIAAVPDAEDVAGVGLVDVDPLLRHELHRAAHRERAAGPDVLTVHAPREPPGADAHERDAVAVVADPCSPGS